MHIDHRSRFLWITRLLAVSLTLILVSYFPVNAQQSTGIFSGQTTIGEVKSHGNSNYKTDTQKYILESPKSDQQSHHIAWKRLSGDFILRARTKLLESNGRTGWIVRSSLDPNANFVSATVAKNGNASLQYRKPSNIETKTSSVQSVDIVQLERTGNNYTMAVAKFGDTFSYKEFENISLGDSVYVGIIVSSDESGASARAAFSNVRIVRPATDTLTPYQEYLGSNLETVDVENGKRHILHQSEESLQAPNWTPDGQTLIYNSNGLLYNFDLDTKEIDQLDTGFADDNNNDHVLSFDGEQIGISHHAKEHDGNSIIYTLPIEGGTPTKITKKGPSYLHGWSPDEQWLTYTGARNGEYDIYKIPTDGGEEVRLTSAEGLDDGSEYSPDGKYIYFNSVRSGSMEIWRMQPDGSNKEQLTDDKFNNWFPHISPDGKEILFLSYKPDVAPGDHPFYKQVYLRKMPANGGEPKVVAYVYGGQGTINVPSWSPDGSKAAFISNTGMK